MRDILARFNGRLVQYTQDACLCGEVETTARDVDAPNLVGRAHGEDAMGATVVLMNVWWPLEPRWAWTFSIQPAGYVVEKMVEVFTEVVIAAKEAARGFASVSARGRPEPSWQARRAQGPRAKAYRDARRPRKVGR